MNGKQSVTEPDSGKISCLQPHGSAGARNYQNTPADLLTVELLVVVELLYEGPLKIICGLLT